MYIQPNTNIKLLKNVPLDTSYTHTILFNSPTDQYNYFNSLKKYELTNYSYQRVKNGISRVGINAENLYDCNYMMFQNNSFGNKWFYAFIKNVEYINNEVSEITFELDVMQTWYFNHTIDECFVEREHTETDEIGEHIEPESVDCGEYVFRDYKNLTELLKPMAICVMINDSSSSSEGTLYDGVYGGCTIFAYNDSDWKSVTAKVNEYNQKPDAIVGMYMCPVIAVSQTGISDGGIQVEYSSIAESFDLTADAISSDNTLNGYLPKNKKLYTYPYCYYLVSNASGTTHAYRYEFFRGKQPHFKVDVSMTMPVQACLRPWGYKSSLDHRCVTEALTITGFPMCSWNTDAYRAWLAQNAIPAVGEYVSKAGIGAVALTGLGVASGGALAVGGALASATAILSQGYQASISADIGKGSLNNGSINVASHTNSFWGGGVCVTHQYAKMIDDYFTRFGYAVKRVKKPNISSRPHWNYVKTVACTLKGSVPADDMKKLCSIYDNGITFWKNGSEIGNYSLDNSV